MDGRPTDARLLLFDRPRVEIRLPRAAPDGLPAWVVLELPGPTAEPRPQGRFLADPRLPESEVVLEWAAVTGAGVDREFLTVRAAGRAWVLEPDPRVPGRWRVHTDPDHHRHWS